MFDLFAVQTCHGTQLQVESATGRICAPRGMSGEEMRRVVLFIPRQARAVGFLLAPQHSPPRLLIEGDPPGGRIIPLRVQSQPGTSSVTLSYSFTHFFTGRYLCALPPEGEHTHGQVFIDRADKGGWEVFTLARLHVPTLPPTIVADLRALEAWFQKPLSGPNILEIVKAGIDPALRDIFDAYARLLEPDEIGWLGSALLAHPPGLANFMSIFAEDPFAHVALPALQAWRQERLPLRHLVIGNTLDSLAEKGIDGRYSSFAHMCNAHARRAIEPQKTIALLATARNEGLYLLEWIAYHRSIGVEAFFIYSNDNNDGSDVLLASLAEAGVISWVKSELDVGHAAQPKAYGHALGVLPHILDYRWTLIIDLDEFFVFDSGRFDSIGDYIAWHESRSVDAVALNWLVYGSNGEDTWRDAPMSARFTRRLPWIDKHIKTLVRTNMAMHSRPHHPAVDARQNLTTRNASGGLQVQDNEPSYSAHPECDTAWINHYFLKSAEEFVWKFSRNRGDHALVRQATPSIMERSFAEMFVQQHRSDTLVTDARILPCARRLTEHYDALLAQPGVFAAMETVKRRYMEEMQQLKAMMRESPDFSNPTSAYGTLAAILEVL
jgi:hypothetical protein